MNIRIFALALVSILLLNAQYIQAEPVQLNPQLQSLSQQMAVIGEGLAAGASRGLERAGKEVTKTLPTKIDLEFSPRSLWGSILSITGAMFIYNGFNQLLNTWKKTDAALANKQEDRTKLYKIGACKIAAGFLSLGASYIVWNHK